MKRQLYQPGLFIGIDWADQKHDCYVIDHDGKGFHQELSHLPEDIDTWIAAMLKRAADHASGPFRSSVAHRSRPFC